VTLLFSFSKCPLFLIKVDFDWNFGLNKYSLRAYLQSFPTTYIKYCTILNDNVNQLKVGLESDKGYFTLKVKTMTLMSHFFCPQ
jgi:capsule polysaccharide export protein KpsC/LpsZ